MTTFEIIQLLVGSGLLLGMARLLFQSGKTFEKIESMEKKIDKLDFEVRNQGERLARTEGAFQERGYWESRRTGTEEKKS